MYMESRRYDIDGMPAPHYGGILLSLDYNNVQLHTVITDTCHRHPVPSRPVCAGLLYRFIARSPQPYCSTVFQRH